VVPSRIDMNIVPKKYSAKVLNNERINERDIKITFGEITPAPFAFNPGQFINIKVSEHAYRSYSIASDSGNPKTLETVASVSHEGVGANYLKSSAHPDDLP